MPLFAPLSEFLNFAHVSYEKFLLSLLSVMVVFDNNYIRPIV